MNSVFGLVNLVSCLFFFFFSSTLIWFDLVFVFVYFLRIFLCLYCTCKVSLHYRYTKVANIVHICKNMVNIVHILEMCTTFANFSVSIIYIYIYRWSSEKVKLEFQFCTMYLDLYGYHTIIILPVAQFKSKIEVQFYFICLNLSGTTS